MGEGEAPAATQAFSIDSDVHGAVGAISTRPLQCAFRKNIYVQNTRVRRGEGEDEGEG